MEGEGIPPNSAGQLACCRSARGSAAQSGCWPGVSHSLHGQKIHTEKHGRGLAGRCWQAAAVGSGGWEVLGEGLA